MMNRLSILESPVVKSSVIASARCSCADVLPKFMKGKTTIAVLPAFMGTEISRVASLTP